MEKNNNNYFIKFNEFKDKNKSPALAVVLAYPFGLLGIHRFYLGRYLSGVVIASFSLCSLFWGSGILAGFFIFISFIEALIFLYYTLLMIKNRIKKYKDINKEILTNREQIIEDERDKAIKLDENDTSNHINKVVYRNNETIKLFGSKEHFESHSGDDMQCVDISHIKPSSVKRDKDFVLTKTSWVDQLDLPYERNVMKIDLIKRETLNMYEKICISLNGYLLERSLSLNSEVRRIYNQDGYYNNLLYTIYCIAEGIVTESYSGRLYFDYWYSYNILNNHLGSSVSEFVLELANSLSLELPPASREVIDYFNLTESGLPKVWWDEDGNMRHKCRFSSEDLNILKVTPSRSSIVWQYRTVKEQIILLYLKLCNLILDSIKNEMYWTEQKVDNINRLVAGNLAYYELGPFRNILSSLLKISENTVRTIIPNIRQVEVAKDELNLQKNLPKEVCVDIKIYLNKFKDNLPTETIKKIIMEITETKLEDWRMKLELFLMLGTEESIEYLVTLSNREDFLNIAKNILKRATNEEQRLLILSILAFDDHLSRNERQELKKLIHSQNWSEFEKLVKNSQVPSKSYFEKVLALQKPIRKRIILDEEKVKSSKAELEQTVSIVEQFIGEYEDLGEKINESDENSEKEIKVENNHLKYVQFIKLLLEKEKLPIESVKKTALEHGNLLNAFISDINRELYEFVQDQVILIKDDYVVLDSFYIDLVKEIIDSEISNQ